MIIKLIKRIGTESQKRLGIPGFRDRNPEATLIYIHWIFFKFYSDMISTGDLFNKFTKISCKLKAINN